jgi:hypothetical protein
MRINPVSAVDGSVCWPSDEFDQARRPCAKAFRDAASKGSSQMRIPLAIIAVWAVIFIVQVLVYALAQDPFRVQWLAYAGLWFVMFAIGEVGQAIGPDYSWQEAILGVIS